MENSLKYDKSLYTDSGFFSGDTDGEYSHETEKLVKCRTQHTCVNCQTLIEPKSYAVLNKVLFNGEGWKSCYICTQCVEAWLEESMQV